MKVKVSDEIVFLCNQFANLTYESSLDEYSRRGQTKKDKIIKDITQGKLAEFATMYYLLEEGHTKVSIPDLNLHRKKSFSPDLTTSCYNIHVKSQSLESFQKYGKSFLFQKKDPLVYNPNPKDRIVTVLCKDINNYEVSWLGSPNDVEWKEPRVIKLRETKVAIYL